MAIQVNRMEIKTTVAMKARAARVTTLVFTRMEPTTTTTKRVGPRVTPTRMATNLKHSVFFLNNMNAILEFRISGKKKYQEMNT